jgi:hypothetical protein
VRPDLAQLVTHYQEALSLRDWVISVDYRPDLCAADGSPVWGLCYPTADAKRATIWIRDPETPPDGASSEDAAAQVVETVVHELVHLHFAPLDLREPAAVRMEEQAVWALSGALVSARGTPQEAQIARAMLAIVPPKLKRMRGAKPQGARRMDLTLDELIKVAKALGMDPATPISDIMARLAGKAPAEPSEPASEPPAAAAAAPEKPADEEPAVAARVAARVATLAGKPAVEAVSEVERWRASHLELESERAKVASERAALEASERRALVVRLVTDCGEAPATAWADDAASKPADPWASMPIAALRARVEKLSGKGAPKDPKPPVGGSDAVMGVHGLDERELAICKETGCEPATFAALKARRASATSARS